MCITESLCSASEQSKEICTVNYLYFKKIVNALKKSTNKCWRKRIEKSELSYTAGGNVSWCCHYGKQYGGSLKN